MNYLFLIGNGFDLAHELPTRYKDFIDDYIRNSIEKAFTQPSLLHDDEYLNFQVYSDVPNPAMFRQEDHQLRPSVFFQNNNIRLNFKNEFLRNLYERLYIQNWVDVEEEYYNMLKDRANDAIDKDTKLLNVKNLNEDFTQLKQLFEKYLEEKVEPLVADRTKIFFNFFKKNKK